MSEDMDFEKKDDVEVKEISDGKNSDVQVKKADCRLYCWRCYMEWHYMVLYFRL